jgi:hypothetical protein
MFMLAMDLNNSPARYDDEPTEPEAKLSAPGLALANAISSLTDFTGNDGCTTKILGELSADEMGEKSLTGSCETLGCIIGKTHSGLPIRSSE